MKVPKKVFFPVFGPFMRFITAINPAPRFLSKEMLAIVGKSLIQCAVLEAAKAECELITFAIGHSKHSIDDHFDRRSELEAKRQTEAPRIMHAIVPPYVQYVFVRHLPQVWLSHTAHYADKRITNEPFVAVPFENLIDRVPRGTLAQIVNAYRYGVINRKNSGTRPLCMQDIVEKPKRKRPLLSLAVVRRYILMPDAIDAPRSQKTGTNDKIQNIDSIAHFLLKGTVMDHLFHGRRFGGRNRKLLSKNYIPWFSKEIVS